MFARLIIIIFSANRFIALANELNKPAPKSTEKDDLYGPPILVHW